MQPEPTAVTRYTWPEARLAEMKAEYATLTATPLADIHDPRMPLVKDALKQLTACRSQTEAVKDELKREILKNGREIDAEYAKRKAAILEIETPIRQEKDRVEAEAKKRAADKVAAEEKAAADEAARLKKIEDDKIAEAKRIEDARLAAERRKLDDERAAFAEQQRLAEEKQKADQAEIDRVAAEEKARIDKERKAEDERRQTEDAERARQKAAIEAQVAKIREEQEKLDRAKFEKETQEREAERAKKWAELQAKEASDKAEGIRLAAERAEKARIEREAAERKAEEEARPDVEKIRGFATLIEIAISGRPTIKPGAAETFVHNQIVALEDIVAKCKNYGKKPAKGKVPG